MSGFLDEVTLTVAAGRGGRGAVSFRREKYVPLGGPDGGDGGHGGSVVVVADSDDATLTAFRERRRFVATAGGNGGKALRSGRNAKDLRLAVPPGTLVWDADSGELLADLDRRGMRLTVAAGGHGGRGNARFATSTRQAPRIGELGTLGESRRIRLELKLIADIGLVGLPNAGKSTLLGALTGARPKIANYPFTTLHPNLGVAEVSGGRTVVIADVPGLIEGAHSGVGLGIDFLRHLERTRVLIHVVDASNGVAAAVDAMRQVSGELAAFSPELAAKPPLLAFNKLDEPAAAETFTEMQRVHRDAYGISAASGRDSCAALLDAAVAAADEVRKAEVTQAPMVIMPVAREGDTTHRVYKHHGRSRSDPVITRDADGFRVVHAATERLVEITDMESEEAVQRLQRRMESVGIDAALAAAGAQEGDTVRIGDAEFLYAEDQGGGRRSRRQRS